MSSMIDILCIIFNKNPYYRIQYKYSSFLYYNRVSCDFSDIGGTACGCYITVILFNNDVFILVAFAILYMYNL